MSKVVETVAARNGCYIAVALIGYENRSAIDDLVGHLGKPYAEGEWQNGIKWCRWKRLVGRLRPRAVEILASYGGDSSVVDVSLFAKAEAKKTATDAVWMVLTHLHYDYYIGGKPLELAANMTVIADPFEEGSGPR